MAEITKPILLDETGQSIVTKLGEIKAAIAAGGGGGGGTSDYEQLENKPQIGGVELTGNKSLSEIGAAAANHNHNGVYQPAGSYATTSDLAGKANASHTHAQSDVTGLATALNGKANASHTHAQSDITGLETALAGKASASDLTDLALKVRDVVSNPLPAATTEGSQQIIYLESGKTYGTPDAPIEPSEDTIISGKNVTNESVMYFKQASNLQITYKGKLNDSPETTETKVCVVSFESGIAVFGVIEPYTITDLGGGNEVD